MKELLAIILSYSLGCLAAGYYLSMLRTGDDIRAQGSGSAGATNVGRRLGASGFIATFLLDALKGAGAVQLSSVLPGMAPGTASCCLLAAVAGHVWPAQLGFKGGRGVSTTLGGLAILDWRLALAVLLLFGLSWALSRSYSLGGLLAILSLAPLAFWMDSSFGPCWALALACVLLFSHRSRIKEFLKDKTERGVQP